MCSHVGGIPTTYILKSEVREMRIDLNRPLKRDYLGEIDCIDDELTVPYICLFKLVRETEKAYGIAVFHPVLQEDYDPKDTFYLWEKIRMNGEEFYFKGLKDLIWLPKSKFRIDKGVLWGESPYLWEQKFGRWRYTVASYDDFMKNIEYKKKVR